jgi:hypothetical protein
MFDQELYEILDRYPEKPCHTVFFAGGQDVGWRKVVPQEVSQSGCLRVLNIISLCSQKYFLW